MTIENHVSPRGIQLPRTSFPRMQAERRECLQAGDLGRASIVSADRAIEAREQRHVVEGSPA